MKDRQKTRCPRILIYCGLNRAASFRKIYKNYDYCYAFEANPDFFSAGLYDEFAKYDNVKIIHAALTTLDGETAFNVFNNDAASSVGSMRSDYLSSKKSRSEFRIERSVTVPAINLYNFCCAHHIDCIEDYISDLQGLDFEVLSTMKPFIEQGKIKNIQCEAAKAGNVYNLPENNIMKFEDLLGRYYDKIAEGDGLLDQGFKPVPKDYWTYDVKWTVKAKGLEQPQYYSQIGQDKILDQELFGGKDKGLFVEVGATDGFHFSNTLFFEKWRGWRGICIEPNPIEFEKLENSGRTCIKENYAISDREGETDFLAIDGYGKGLSGIISSYDPKHLARIERELKGRDSTRHLYKVKTIPLQKLFDRHNITYVDYCSIDVEGAEMQVLQSIDYDKTFIKCFTIENNYGLESETKYLASKGYYLWKRVGWDDFFVRSEALSSVHGRKVDKDVILKLINAHHAAFLPLDQPVVMEEVSPLDLVTWKRFDVVAKYIYARHRERGINGSWAYQLYDAHEKAFNNYDEKDGSGKKGISAFIEEFHKTLDAIRESGFDSSKSAVPVSYTNNLIDGSHRVAACLYYNRPLAVLRFNFEGWHYPYDFFRKRGLSEVFCDAIAYEYCRLKKNTHIVLLFPSAVGQDDEVRKILREYSTIYYEKSVQLLQDAPLLLMTQVYKEESWLGDLKKGYPGAALKARECFRGTGPLRVFVIETDMPETLKEAKDRIRALYNISNHSVHINDSHKETILLAQILLNDNSILFMNRCRLAYLPQFRKNYKRYAALLSDVVDRENYCVTASAVLALHGMRDARDIDYLHFGEALPKEKDISSHNTEMHYYPFSASEVIFDPRNHFYFDGLKFASLEVIKRLKEKRNEEKDQKDRALIMQAEERGKGDRNGRSETTPVITDARQALPGRRGSIPLLSIVILNYNGLSHLKVCLAAICNNTPEEHEIIVFDNASTDGSLEFLRTQKDIILIESEINIGCPPGRARALSAARGEFVVLLDNDTVVTSGWSTRFLAHARRLPEIGIMGPRSNYVSGAQLVPGVSYKDFDGLKVFADQWAAEHTDELLPTHRLVGFCLFIRRSVIDKIGNIDALFGKFGFEDDDYVWRAIIAGFNAAIANDVFIHHTGGPQGRGDSSYNQQLMDAWGMFKKKWQLPMELAYGAPYNPLPVLLQIFREDRHYIPLEGNVSSCKNNEVRLDELPRELLQEYEQIRSLANENKGDEAIKKLLALAEKYPNKSFLLNDLGVLYGDSGNLEKSESYYQKAIALEPDNITFKKNLADYYLLLRSDSVKAVALYTEVLKKHPSDIETLLALGNICFSADNFKDAELFYQKVLESEPADPIARRGMEEIALRNDVSRNGRTSIIIVPSAAEGYLVECLRSISKNTPELYEVIILEPNHEDNINIKELSADVMDVTWITAVRENGYVAQLNAAVSSSSGEFMVILKDDVIVTEGWLSGLLHHAALILDAGLIGPVVAHLPGRQGYIGIAYSNSDELCTFSSLFRDRNRHRFARVRSLENTCLFVKRAVQERIGLFDEDLEDDGFIEDFCLRSEIAGFRNIIAGDVLITVKGGGAHEPQVKKIRKFSEKWSNIDHKAEAGRKVLLVHLREKAADLFAKGDFEHASNTLIAGIKSLPGCKELYYDLAEKLIEFRQFEVARNLLDQMTFDDEVSHKLVLQGYIEEGLEHYTAAADCADRVLSREPNNALALNLRGLISYRQGDTTVAVESFRAAIAADPSCAEPYSNLGVIIWSSGDQELGFSNIERGCILAPQVKDHSTLYHSVITESGRFERGLMIFREAHELYPNNKQIIFLLIDLLARQEKFIEAMDYIEHALSEYELEDGMLAGALAVREKLGPKVIPKDSKASVSQCMIVKNEEKELAKCLNSVKTLADEIVIADTGSTDRTTDIARVFGARVLSIPWQGDFSAARNVSLEHATGAWVIILDADEVIASQDVGRLKKLIAQSEKKSAYSFITRNYSDKIVANWIANSREYPEEAGTGWFPSDKVRLFPNDRNIAFENPVHELVEPSLKRASYSICESGIPIHHYGKLNPAKADEKGEAYYLIGREKLGKNDRNPNAIFELAVQATELCKYEDAAELWDRLMLLRPNFDGAYIGAVTPLLELGRFDEALVAARKGLALSPDKRETVFKYGICEFYHGNDRAAVDVLARYLAKDAEYPPILALLALLYLIQGRQTEGIDLVLKIIRMGFNFAEYAVLEAGKAMSRGRSRDACMFLKALIDAQITSTGIQELYSQSCTKQEMTPGVPEEG